MKRHFAHKRFALCLFLLSHNLFAQDFSFSFGPEMNMNAPEYFAGALSLGFDFNLPLSITPFAVGINIIGSSNFSGINVLEISALFRWYFLNLTSDSRTSQGNSHIGFFAQANLGYNYIDIEGAPIALISELRGGYRFPLGAIFFIEPYGRIGYPVMWGLGVLGGIQFPIYGKEN